MKERLRKVTDLFHDPIFLTRFHGWATIAWFIAAFPICILLSESIAFIVFISVYAIVVGHWSSWQASRVEVKQDEQDPNTDTDSDTETDAPDDKMGRPWG